MNPPKKSFRRLALTQLALSLLGACAVDESVSTLAQGDWELRSLTCFGTEDTSVFDEGTLSIEGEKATLSLTSGSCTLEFPFTLMFQGETRVRFGGSGEIGCDPVDCDADLCGADITGENWGFSVSYDDTTEPETPTLALESLETDRGPSTSCSDAGLDTPGGYLFERPN